MNHASPWISSACLIRPWREYFWSSLSEAIRSIRRSVFPTPSIRISASAQRESALYLTRKDSCGMGWREKIFHLLEKSGVKEQRGRMHRCGCLSPARIYPHAPSCHKTGTQSAHPSTLGIQCRGLERWKILGNGTIHWSQPSLESKIFWERSLFKKKSSYVS